MRSQKDPQQAYRVRLRDEWYCDCQDFQRHAQTPFYFCKHIEAVRLFEQCQRDLESAIPIPPSPLPMDAARAA